MIGHAKDMGSTKRKNRYKVIILIMHKRMRGNWVFIDMINGGVACLADEVQVQGLQRRGQPPIPNPPLSTNNNQGGNISTMHNHMVEG